MITHIWNCGKKGWMLELATGNSLLGHHVTSVLFYPTKIAAKQAAKAAGAQPWNY